jgi:hypothetical protein
MIKIDLRKELKGLYNPPGGKFSLVEAPAMNFIMIDGAGDPNTSQEYQDAIEALYALSYTLKFTVKKEQALDYAVMPLEGLWWTDDMAEFSPANKSIWKWTAMIMQPQYVTPELFKGAMEQAGKKKRLPSLPKARFQNWQEGLSVQIMYTGPYADEGPLILKMHNYARDNGYVFDGRVRKHHEIYLNDFRRTAPEKLKTVIRQPVEKKS